LKKDSNFELCEAVCRLDDNILGSALLDKGMIIAGFSKPGVSVPNEERFAKILFQLEVITSLHRGNEDFYGMLKYHSVQYAESTLYVFPTDKFGSEKPLILAFKVSRPHSHDKISSQVEQLLESFFDQASRPLQG
jgi:hypothetical protein